MKIWLSFLAAGLAAVQGAEQKFEVHLEVRNEAGSGIPAVEASWTLDSRPHSWVALQGEKVSFTTDTPLEALKDVPLSLLVRASGYPTVEVPVTPDQLKEKIAVKLPSGKPITVTVQDARPIPQGMHLLPFPASLAKTAFLGIDVIRFREPISLVQVEQQKDRFKFLLGPEDKTFFIFIQEPGFLVGQLSGPFHVSKLKDPFTLALQETSALKATFDPKETSPDQHRRIVVKKTISVQLPDGSRETLMLPIAQQTAPSGVVTIDRADLPSWTYTVAGETFNPADPLESEPFEDKKVELSKKQPAEVALHGTSAVAALKGDTTAKVLFKRPGGKGAPMPYSVRFRDAKNEIVLARGTLDSSGRAEVKNLKGGTGAPIYSLQIGTETFRLQLKGEEKVQDVVIAAPPGIGDNAPDLVLQEAFGGNAVKLSDFGGKVLYIDFWATWCGPCQEPMNENNEIMTRRKNDWKGKAEILGVSIDDTVEALQKHVESKSWKEVHHLWSTGEGKGWQCPAVEVYGIRGVPTAILIDPTGRIVWRGHPAEIQVEKKIDEMIAAAGKTK